MSAFKKTLDIIDEKRGTIPPSGEGKVEARMRISTPSSTFAGYEEYVCSPSEGFDIVDGFVYIIAGTTGTGKTTLLRNIVHHNSMKFNKIWLICPTLSRTPKDYDWLPAAYKTEETAGMVEKVFEEMKAVKGMKGLLILDDVVGEMKLRGTDLWKKIGSTSRKYGITTLLLTQKLNETDTTVRDNTAGVFVTKIGKNSKDTLIPMIQGEWNGGNKEKLDFINAHQGKKDRHILRFNIGAGSDQPVQIFKSLEPPKFFCYYT